MDDVGEKRIIRIKEETKELLDKFSKSLEKIKSSEENNIEREENRRKEGEGEKGNDKFRESLFENAIQKNKNFIIAEKKSW